MLILLLCKSKSQFILYQRDKLAFLFLSIFIVLYSTAEGLALSPPSVSQSDKRMEIYLLAPPTSIEAEKELIGRSKIDFSESQLSSTDQELVYQVINTTMLLEKTMLWYFSQKIEKKYITSLRFRFLSDDHNRRVLVLDVNLKKPNPQRFSIVFKITKQTGEDRSTLYHEVTEFLMLNSLGSNKRSFFTYLPENSDITKTRFVTTMPYFDSTNGWQEFQYLKHEDLAQIYYVKEVVLTWQKLGGMMMSRPHGRNFLFIAGREPYQKYSVQMIDMGSVDFIDPKNLPRIKFERRNDGQIIPSSEDVTHLLEFKEWMEPMSPLTLVHRMGVYSNEPQKNWEPTIYRGYLLKPENMIKGVYSALGLVHASGFFDQIAEEIDSLQKSGDLHEEWAQKNGEYFDTLIRLEKGERIRRYHNFNQDDQDDSDDFNRTGQNKIDESI